MLVIMLVRFVWGLQEALVHDQVIRKVDGSAGHTAIHME